MKIYPSWRYHKTEKPALVTSEEADKALGKDWADSPAAFLQSSQEKELLKLNEEELIEKLSDSGLKKSTLKRRTKKQLAEMIVEESDGHRK